MFFKELENGKVRYFEKFYNERESKWQQVTVTLGSKSRAVQAEAKIRLAQKIDKARTDNANSNSSVSTQAAFDEWQVIREKELKASSFFSESNILKGFLSRFGSKKLANVHSNELQMFLLGVKYAPQSLANLKCKIDIFFRYALKRGYINDNPMTAVVLAKRKLSEERLAQNRKKYLTHDEMKQVLRVVENAGRPRPALCLEFLFLTGLRIGELLALQFEDYDAEGKKLHVRHTLNYAGHSVNERLLQSPKTVHSYRTLSLDKRSLEILDIFKHSQADRQFIFTLDDGRTPSRDLLARYLRSACLDALGLTKDQAPTLHGLRHSHISLLAELGVPMKLCIDRVGHADEKMILRIYAHVTPKMEDELLAKMDALN